MLGTKHTRLRVLVERDRGKQEGRSKNKRVKRKGEARGRDSGPWEETTNQRPKRIWKDSIGVNALLAARSLAW